MTESGLILFFLPSLPAIITSWVLETKECCLKGFGRERFAYLSGLQLVISTSLSD